MSSKSRRCPSRTTKRVESWSVGIPDRASNRGSVIACARCTGRVQPTGVGIALNVARTSFRRSDSSLPGAEEAEDQRDPVTCLLTVEMISSRSSKRLLADASNDGTRLWTCAPNNSDLNESWRTVTRSRTDA